MVTAHEPLCAAVEACLAEGPMKTGELRARLDAGRYEMNNAIRTLLRTGRISRVQISVGRFLYYPGQTAPGYTGYQPDTRKKPEPIRHAIPTKVVDVARQYFGDATPRPITLPAAPWELSQ